MSHRNVLIAAVVVALVLWYLYQPVDSAGNTRVRTPVPSGSLDGRIQPSTSLVMIPSGMVAAARQDFMQSGTIMLT